MSIPTFATVALLTDSERQSDTAPKARVSLAEMPGVDGSYVQQAGLGAKEITIEGFLEATDAVSYALALAALRAAIAAIRLKVGAAPGALVDCSATTVNNCLLTEYRQSGPFLLGMRNTTFVARVAVEARVLQLDPNP